MQQITTLVDRYGAAGQTGLSDELKKLYGGDLRFAARQDRPYVVGNFVSSLDGVVSLAIPGRSGGGEISGFDKADRFIMGLLRASADAVMVGSGTLKDTPSQHLWVADHAYPEAGELYARYRQEILHKPSFANKRHREPWRNRRPSEGSVSHTRTERTHHYLARWK